MSEKKAVILLAEGFEEIEFSVPTDVLRRAGVEVTVAGVSGETVTGSHGIKITADKLLNDLLEDGEEFDAVILPGGLPGAYNLRDSEAVSMMVKNTFAAGKIVAAICAAPLVLNANGILAGKRFTAYPEKSLFPAYGAEPSELPAVQDGNVVTGRGPGAAFDFAFAVLKALGMEKHAGLLAEGMLVK